MAWRALKRLILEGANAGQLHLALAFQRGGGNDGSTARPQEAESNVEIAAEDFGIDAEAVVAAVGVDAASDGFDFGGDLLSGAFCGPFEQHLGG